MVRSGRGFVRRIGWLMPIAILVASIGGAVQGQAAAPPKKYFSAIFDPASVAAGATSTATLKLTNNTSSQTTLGSANVTIPFGWSVVSDNPTARVYTAAGSATARTWSASVPDQTVSRTIGLSANASSNALSPGEQLRVPLTVVAPCTGTGTWTTYVKQSNDFNGTGNDFALQGSQPTLSASAGPAQALRFVQQPTNSAKGVAISPAVTVKLVDGCGNAVPQAADVTMSVGDD